MTTVTDQIIVAALKAARPARGQRYVHAGGRGMNIHTGRDRIIWLPNGARYNLTTSDCGTTLHLIDDNHQHATVRPEPIGLHIRRNP